MYNNKLLQTDTPDVNSALNRLYKYFWEYPNATVIPNEILPEWHQVYYIFNTVKHLREGTEHPPLTIAELVTIMDDEFPNWREQDEDLPDSFYERHGIDARRIKRTDRITEEAT